MFWIVVVAYIVAMAWALYMAWRRPLSVQGKAVAIVVALAAFSVLPAIWLRNTLDRRHAEEESRQRHKAAAVYFGELCRAKAGEKIYQTTVGVGGIFLSNPRKAPRERDLEDQYWAGDPYGVVMYPPAELAGYLFDLSEHLIPSVNKTKRPGYWFVETPYPGHEGVLRFTVDAKGDGIQQNPVPERTARYSVRREDISTEEDRRHWVAGGRLTVVDDRDGRVLGERIGYVFEAGFGSTAHGRRPWLVAQTNACPEIPRNRPIDRLFVEKILVPAAPQSGRHYAR